MKKHATELKAFQKKIQSKIEAMKKQRALELEQLLQKYQNIKKDLETQNSLELKKLKSHPGKSFNVSKMQTSKPKGKKGESPVSLPSEI